MKNLNYVCRIIEETQIKSLNLDPYSIYTALELPFRHSEVSSLELLDGEMARRDYLPRMEPQTLISFAFGQDKKPSCNGEWRHMISVTIKTTTKRLIIHEAESTHNYHHKYPLEIHSTRKKN